MPTFISLGSRLRIPAAHHAAALEALHRSTITLATGRLGEVMDARAARFAGGAAAFSLTDTLWSCGWRSYIGPEDAIIGLGFIDEQITYDHQLLFDALAPFIEPAGILLGLCNDDIVFWSFDGQSAIFREGEHVGALVADLLAADARAKHAAARLVCTIHIHQPLTDAASAALWDDLAALGFRRDPDGAGEIEHYPDGDVVEVAGWLRQDTFLAQLAAGLHQRLGGTGKITIAATAGDGATIATRYPPLPDSGPVTVSEAEEIVNDRFDDVDGPFLWEPLVKRLLAMSGAAIIALLHELLTQPNAELDGLLGAYGSFITDVLRELEGVHPDFDQLTADDVIGDYYE